MACLPSLCHDPVRHFVTFFNNFQDISGVRMFTHVNTSSLEAMFLRNYPEFLSLIEIFFLDLQI